MTELCGVLISELSDIGTIDGSELCSESLFLVSQKIDKEQSKNGFISRKLQYKQFKEKLDSDLSISDMHGQIQKMTDGFQTSSVLSCKSELPYILSSYIFKNGGLISADGYPLSAGIDIVFKKVEFDTLSVWNFHCREFKMEDIQVGGNASINGNTTIKQNINISGNINLNGKINIPKNYTPTSTNDVATKKYVDDQCAKGQGTVKSVNKISPDNNGNIDLTCYRCETFNFYTKDNPDTPIPYKIMLSAN